MGCAASVGCVGQGAPPPDVYKTDPNVDPSAVRSEQEDTEYDEDAIYEKLESKLKELDKGSLYYDQESVPTKIATVSTADGHGGHVQKEVWRQRYLVLDDELSEEDSDEDLPQEPTPSFVVVLGESQQQQLTDAFKELADGDETVPLATAFAHFTSLGMQAHRILQFAEEAGVAGETLSCEQWIHFFECIAKTEGGDTFLSILISRSSTVLAALKNKKYLMRIYARIDVAQTKALPRGTACAYFTSAGAPSDFVFKYELMEDMFCDDEGLEEVGPEAFTMIFESLFADKAMCEWMVHYNSTLD